MQNIRTRKQLNYLACQIDISVFLKFSEHWKFTGIYTVQNRKLDEVNNKLIREFTLIEFFQVSTTS